MIKFSGNYDVTPAPKPDIKPVGTGNTIDLVEVPFDTILKYALSQYELKKVKY